MAKSARRTPPSTASQAVTAERAVRLVQLLQILGTGPQLRSTLVRRLGLDVRSFFRDLGLLRSVGVRLATRDHHYTLQEPLGDALNRLPFPDPHLTLGEARQLAQGRSAAHQKVQEMIHRIGGRASASD